MASKHPNNLAMYPFFEQPLLMRRVHQLRAIGEAVSISGSPEGLVSPTVSRIPMALSMTPSRFQGLKVSRSQGLKVSKSPSLSHILPSGNELSWPCLETFKGVKVATTWAYSISICCTSVLRCCFLLTEKKVKHRTLAAPSLTSSVRCNLV